MESIFFLKYFVLSYLIVEFYCIEDPELQLVLLVMSHGDRAPIDQYATDPNSEEVWKEGLGSLTMLGKRQHYSLGLLLREMYGNFTTFSPLDIEAVSSDADRCIDGIQTTLASFFAPTDEWKFKSGVDWQPIPIRYIERREDRIHIKGCIYCPAACKEQKRIMQSEDVQVLLKNNEEMFQYLTNYSHKSIKTLSDAAELFDTLQIESKHQLSIPSWANTYWDQLKNLSDLTFYLSFNSPLMLRLSSGPLLKELSKHMGDKISNIHSEKKIHIYSMHDSTLAMLLQSMNVSNMKQPPYCATIIFELYRVNDTYEVRLLYLNSSEPEIIYQLPHNLEIDGCSDYCPFDRFNEFIMQVIPDNWESECMMELEFFGDHQKFVFITVFITAVAMTMAGIIFFVLIFGIKHFLPRMLDVKKKKKTNLIY